jgi:MFS transporter, PPP family, 3-phenylpropionic acid transporter
LRSIKTQYFLCFAVMGSFMPFLSIWLEEEGLSRVQIGYVIGVASVAVLVTPVLLTFLADMRIDIRRLLAGVFMVSGATLAALYAGQGFWPILILFTLHNFAYVPTMPLQDTLYFALQKQRKEAGEVTTPYHRIRVWGTIGFIVPSILLFWLLRWGQPTSMVLLVGAGVCALGLLNTLRLPDPRIRAQPQPHEALPPASRLPTLQALRAMTEPHLLVFCIGMGLAHMASAAYYGFYPLYLTREVGISREWAGLISSIGVGIEILFMLGYGWLLRRMGLKGLVALGMAAMALRFLLLAGFPVAGVAIGIQLFHGITVVVMHVVPPTFLNRHAGDAYRSSMQGVYTVAVMGVSRMIGSFIAGYVANVGLTTAFWYGGIMCIAAAGLFIFAFKEIRRPPDKPAEEAQEHQVIDSSQP